MLYSDKRFICSFGNLGKLAIFCNISLHQMWILICNLFFTYYDTEMHNEHVDSNLKQSVYSITHYIVSLLTDTVILDNDNQAVIGSKHHFMKPVTMEYLIRLLIRPNSQMEYDIMNFLVVMLKKNIQHPLLCELVPNVLFKLDPSSELFNDLKLFINPVQYQRKVRECIDLYLQQPGNEEMMMNLLVDLKGDFSKSYFKDQTQLFKSLSMVFEWVLDQEDSQLSRCREILVYHSEFWHQNKTPQQSEKIKSLFNKTIKSTMVLNSICKVVLLLELGSSELDIKFLLDNIFLHDQFTQIRIIKITSFDDTALFQVIQPIMNKENKIFTPLTFTTLTPIWYVSIDHSTLYRS
ncbi:hypothetical protein DLAC_02432 [Tieghemostelium lacteum]|uniref:Uncharacterized protein n=1 Tax=Tieghemostelium lacteum TaxID=361077 RepID=A0A152A2H7_TIELA|nr:hypothetical protein DLAC_02432 [Tieghemostelium lacteum]|eukprot:KYR00438.1 hypothetical protein DLAC_02432 [Tieghemostelium lacteum]